MMDLFLLPNFDCCSANEDRGSSQGLALDFEDFWPTFSAFII